MLCVPSRASIVFQKKQYGKVGIVRELYSQRPKHPRGEAEANERRGLKQPSAEAEATSHKGRSNCVRTAEQQHTEAMSTVRRHRNNRACTQFRIRTII